MDDIVHNYDEYEVRVNNRDLFCSRPPCCAIQMERFIEGDDLPKHNQPGFRGHSPVGIKDFTNKFPYRPPQTKKKKKTNKRKNKS
jgi:hypothetical protein